ncbi:MAG TPA: HNH endonuclease signature motif containing protein, partial [Candidatus Eisenbacteria bacterium]|nr:HNH endonuclease signature motif containing protein [Candidatus Eisenbacteria bacterium]
TSGYFSVRSLVADAARASSAAGTRISRLGTALASYPLLAGGVLAGRIHPDAARAASEGIASAVSDLRGAARDEARALGEAIIVPVCETNVVADVEKVAAGLILRLDPQSAARRALEALERREVKVGAVGAVAVVRMVLDAMTAAQLVAVLEARIDRWFRAGSLPEDLQPTGGEDEDLRRRIAARSRLLADAFAELVAEMLAAEPSTKHGAPVAVSLIVSEDIHAAGGPGELQIPGRDGVPVPHEVVELALCDAEITPIHVHALMAQKSSLGQIAAADRRVREAAAPRPAGSGGAGDIHDLTGICGHVHCVGRRERTATRDQRALLTVRDRHCRFPGCRVDPARCQAHHVKTWERDNGATCLSNMVLLCARHHSLVHNARWTIEPDPHLDPGHPDRWRFTPPATGYVGKDGQLVADRLRRGQPPEPPGPPPPAPDHAAA